MIWSPGVSATLMKTMIFWVNLNFRYAVNNLIITSFILSPRVVKVTGTDWVEPTLLWLTSSMPTGSRKTNIISMDGDIEKSN